MAILSGNLKYDPKRDFTTVKSKAKFIQQNGDIEFYAHQILQMRWAGTNRQSMGIYGGAKEKITIYVKSSVDTDPLPKIRFTQYLGGSNWLGSTHQLKLGKQTITVDDFKLDKNLGIPTFPGRPLYLINPYTSTEQKPIFIYVEGGTVFPTISLFGDETEYKKQLLECINLNKKNNLTYFDITELYSRRAMITVRASTAYKIY